MLLQSNSYFLWLKTEQIILNPSNFSVNPFKQKSTVIETLLPKTSTGAYFCCLGKKTKNPKKLHPVKLPIESHQPFNSHLNLRDTTEMDKAVVTVLTYLYCVLWDPALTKNIQLDDQVHKLMYVKISNNPGFLLLSDSKLSQD